MSQINQEADAAEAVLRIAMAPKATVNIGPFSRGGKSWVPVAASDHAFETTATVTPVGIFLPKFDALFLYMVCSKVTSDCLVDRLVQWWESVYQRFSHIHMWVIHLDNGPENHSRRTQFIKRIVDCVMA